jgi:hypothetical protein
LSIEALHSGYLCLEVLHLSSTIDLFMSVERLQQLHRQLRTTQEENTDTMAASPLSIQQLFSLEGQTALVTGGTRGIGQTMALALAEAGADILLVQVCVFYIFCYHPI